LNPVDLIIKKRDGHSLNQKEIEFFIRGVSQDLWPDYQVAALLMALFLRGMNDDETAAMTLAMAASGEQFDLSDLPGIKVDKHSTGGVADTTTLILLPLVAACGAPVIKISGRGLGFTGGTIDKLESIPGFRVDLTRREAIEQVRRSKLALMAQTENLTPADKKLYALRDVTGTVDSIPLIAASIMSKKIAAGADALVLDVKCGNGAFMNDLSDARHLAQTMVNMGRNVGRDVKALITDMNQPLGHCIGNTLEVMEAIEVLKGKQKGNLLTVALALGKQMLLMARAAHDPAEAEYKLKQALDSGAALERFRLLLSEQGGDAKVIDDYSRFLQPRYKKDWCPSENGYIDSINTAGLGHLFVELGGGRKVKSDPIDPSAGFILNAQLGDYHAAHDPLVTLQGMDEEKMEHVYRALNEIFRFSSKPRPRTPVVLEML
jgi:pyrimidine-nucleoside phosphorylase